MRLLLFIFRKHWQKDPGTETTKQHPGDTAMLLLHCDVYLFTSDLSFPLPFCSLPSYPSSVICIQEVFPYLFCRERRETRWMCSVQPVCNAGNGHCSFKLKGAQVSSLPASCFPECMIEPMDLGSNIRDIRQI